MIDKQHSKKGFTLIELLLYITMFSLLTTVLTGIFTNIVDAKLESEVSSSIEQDARFIVARLTYDIQRANSITTPATTGGQSNSLQLNIAGVSHTYSLVSGNLQMTNNLGTFHLNGFNSTISNLSFTRRGNASGDNTITLEFQIISRTVKTGEQEIKNVRTTIGLR